MLDRKKINRRKEDNPKLAGELRSPIKLLIKATRVAAPWNINIQIVYVNPIKLIYGTVAPNFL